jgi:hypothetical protein
MWILYTKLEQGFDFSEFLHRERVAVKLIQVVAMGPGAERLQERLHELSFKRDELRDRYQSLSRCVSWDI